MCDLRMTACKTRAKDENDGAYRGSVATHFSRDFSALLYEIHQKYTIFGNSLDPSWVVKAISWTKTLGKGRFLHEIDQNSIDFLPLLLVFHFSFVIVYVGSCDLKSGAKIQTVTCTNAPR